MLQWGLAIRQEVNEAVANHLTAPQEHDNVYEAIKSSYPWRIEMQYPQNFASDQIEKVLLRMARTRRISDSDLDILIQYIQFLRGRADVT